MKKIQQKLLENFQNEKIPTKSVAKLLFLKSLPQVFRRQKAAISKQRQDIQVLPTHNSQLITRCGEFVIRAVKPQ